MVEILSNMTEPVKPGGVELFGCGPQFVEQSTELHAASSPERVGSLYYVACSCGWVSEGKDTPTRAALEVCAFEAAGVIAARNRRHFLSACRAARVIRF